MDKNFRQVPEKQYRPDVRWWLAEGLHTDQTLKNEMQQLDDMGMGAMEFLAMTEPGADSKLYGWGSEEWVHDTHTLVKEAADRNMGVSMTCGTNWANANLISITPDDKAAAKELDYVFEVLSPNESRSGDIPKSDIKMPNVHAQDFVAAVAARVVGKEGRKPVLAKDTIVLTGQVKDGKLEWTAPAEARITSFSFGCMERGKPPSLPATFPTR